MIILFAIFYIYLLAKRASHNSPFNYPHFSEKNKIILSLDNDILFQNKFIYFQLTKYNHYSYERDHKKIIILRKQQNSRTSTH